MLSPSMKKMYLSAVEAAEIVRRTLNSGITAKTKEGEPGGSHHAIGTEADVRSQEFLFRVLREQFPGTLFLGEEGCEDADAITDDNVKLVNDTEKMVCVVDPLDGTAGAYRQRWDWSVSLNLKQGGIFTGGVVIAPDVRNGLSVVGDNGRIFCKENESLFEASGLQPRTMNKSTVLYGVDILKRRQFSKFANVVANTVETAVIAGSCALGVATVAIGKAEAIIQPHQWPWDWATAATLIPAAGGKVIWYHYRKGQLVRLSEPDLPAYSRTNRTVQGGLGFIAGCPDITEWLWTELQQHWTSEREEK